MAQPLSDADAPHTEALPIHVPPTHEGRAITGPDYDLAEGVIWDDRAGLLRWVDIWAGRVLSGVLEGDRVTDIRSLDLGQTVGAVALAEDGGLLVAGARSLITISPESAVSAGAVSAGAVPEGAISVGPDLLGDRSDVRFNDGSVDPQGRFLVGTLALGETTGLEVLLRVSPDGSVETLREGIRLSNGIGFSPDGGTVYHTDTDAGTVSRHSYGPGAFDHDEPWVTVLDDFAHHPDGVSVDSEGMLWVAQWGGSRVLRFSPTGVLLATVTVDATQASCPGFVGPDLDRLVITTAQEGLGAFTDQSGALFVAEVGATGLPSPRWGGSTIHPYWT